MLEVGDKVFIVEDLRIIEAEIIKIAEYMIGAKEETVYKINQGKGLFYKESQLFSNKGFAKARLVQTAKTKREQFDFDLAELEKQRKQVEQVLEEVGDVP